jgi:hypothetical protein
MAAQSAETRKKREAQARQQAAHRRRILEAGGPAALELMQREAFEAGRCGWELSKTEVCRRKADPVRLVWWCRQHNRQNDREQAQKAQ